MEMLGRWLALPLIVGIFCSLMGAWSKILHRANADTLLATGLICSLLFTILALVEIWNTNLVKPQDRIRWTVALVLLGSIGGLIYLVFRRRQRVL